MMNLTNQLPKIIRQFALCVKSRAEAVIIYSWLSVIGLFIVCRGFPPPILLLKVFFAMTGTALGAYLYNDLCDFEDDMLGRELGASAPSNRPLGSGLVSKKIMGVFVVTMVATGLIVGALVNTRVFLLQVMSLILNVLYSAEPIRLKKRFLFKQLTIALGGVIACLTAGMAVGVVTGHLFYLMVLYVAVVFGVNPLVDLRDIRGDSETGVKTIPIVWGPEFTIKLALATFVAMSISSFVVFYGLDFNLALPILGTTILLTWAYVTYPLLRNWRDQEYTEKAVYRRGLPLYFLLQLTVLIGSIKI